MEKLNLKNALKSLKEKNSQLNKDKKYIKNSDIIQEKIKESQSNNGGKSKGILKDFSDCTDYLNLKYYHRYIQSNTRRLLRFGSDAIGIAAMAKP